MDNFGFYSLIGVPDLELPLLTLPTNPSFFINNFVGTVEAFLTPE